MKRPAHKDLMSSLAALGDAVEKLRGFYQVMAPSIQNALTGPEPDVKVVTLGGDQTDPETPAEQVPAAAAGVNPRHAVVDLQLRMVYDKIEEVLVAFDDCYAHMRMSSALTEWRTKLKSVPFCDWCAYLGKTIRSTGSWSEGDDAVNLCQPHHFRLVAAMGNDLKLWKHEPIHAWQSAGYPDPAEFLKKWNAGHPE
jgi:hypothetical protein